jgi:hypothetical protein
MTFPSVLISLYVRSQCEFSNEVGCPEDIDAFGYVIIDVPSLSNYIKKVIIKKAYTIAGSFKFLNIR